MADVDHPKTHVENQEDVTLPREQPESPKHEGIDPLTEGDTMYREGKAKRTPVRGVKQNLKPCTYKQWEPFGVTAYLLYGVSTATSG